MTREHMSPVDAAWLRMDRPTNLMVIVGVMLFEGPLDFERFRDVVARRFAVHRRFRARPVEAEPLPAWEDDPDFDLDAHVRRTALPAPAGRAELEALVGGLAGTDMDHRRPLWEFHVVEDCDGCAAVVLRIHHCYADGIALMRVFMDMTDAAPAPRRARRRRAGPLAWLGQLPVPGVALAARALAGSGQWLARAADLALRPAHATALAQHGSGLLVEALKVALLPPDGRSPLRGPLGRRKQVAWGPRLPLAEVSTIARSLGCTVNDVLMATAAGALGGYLRERGRTDPDLVIRATVPVNLRGPEDGSPLGNAFGLVFLELPVGIDDPLARLAAVRASMQSLKHSYQPLLMLGLLGALGMAPAPVESAAIDLLSAKSSLVASNVPGPREPVSLAGTRVAELMFWVPQSGALGAGLSLLSYAGAVQLGLLADARRIPEPRAVVARFPAEFERLVLAALLGPLALPAAGAAGAGAVTRARPSPARRRAAPSRRPARSRRPSGTA